MLPHSFCSAKFTSALWKTILTASGSLALVTGSPWLDFARQPAASLGSGDGTRASEGVYSDSELHALRTADRAVRDARVAESLERSPSPSVRAAREQSQNSIRVGMRWIVGAQRVRPQQMKPLGSEVSPKNYRESLKDLAVFRYEIIEKFPDGSFDVSIKPILDEGAGVNTRSIDGFIDELRLRVDVQGRQVAKSYTYISGLKGDVTHVEVSPDGLRSQLTAFETFPLDWPSGFLGSAESRPKATLRSGRTEQATESIVLPTALSELTRRSTFGGEKSDTAGRPLRRAESDGERLSGNDFFGRPIDALVSKEFPWPKWMSNSQGVAVLLEIESTGN